MRRQWTDYDLFNLIELIDELKTRIKEPHRPDDILHGMIISLGNKCDYVNLVKLLVEFLMEDDKKGND